MEGNILSAFSLIFQFISFMKKIKQSENNFRETKTPKNSEREKFEIEESEVQLWQHF